MNYKLRILSSLAAKAYSSSGNESSNEFRLPTSNEGSASFMNEGRKRDKKAVVKVLYHKGQNLHQQRFTHNFS